MAEHIEKMAEELSTGTLARRLAAAPRHLPQDLCVDGEDYALFPLTQAQRHLFAHQQRHDEGTAYNIAAGLAVDAALDPDALHDAVLQLMQRHEALRTHFVFRQGEIYQCVRRDCRCDFTYTDLSAQAAAETAALAALHEAAVRPYDLMADVLFRVHVFRTGKTRYLLSLGVHHIVADYRSMEILVSDLNTLFLRDVYATAPLQTLRLQFADYALWERAYLRSDPAQRQRQFWLDRLAGMPQLKFPPASRTAVDEPDGWNSFRLDASLLEPLRQRARAGDVTVFMLGIAALHMLVHAFCGQADVAIGTPISTRRVEDLELSVGLLLNTLVIRLDASPAASVDGFLGHVRQRCTEAFEQKDYPYEGLLHDLASLRPVEGEPYRVRYVYRRVAGAQQPAAQDVQLERRQAKFDLLVSLNEADDHLFGELEFRRAVIDPDAAADLCRGFTSALSALTDPAATSLDTLTQQIRDLLNDAARERRQQRNSELGASLQSLIRSPSASASSQRS